MPQVNNFGPSTVVNMRFTADPIIYLHLSIYASCLLLIVWNFYNQIVTYGLLFVTTVNL